MKRIAYLFILCFLTTCFVMVSSSQGMQADQKACDQAVTQIFKNFLGRPPSTSGYEGAEKVTEKTKFRQILLSAQGRDKAQLQRDLNNKIRDIINIITDRDEYRQKVQPMTWTEKYWRDFVTKCQRNFENKFNANPGNAINELTQKAFVKKLGTEIREVQTEVMKVYKESRFFDQYVNSISDKILKGYSTPKYDRIVNEIFKQFLQRSPSKSGGNESEFNRFVSILKESKGDRELLATKIKEVIITITDRMEYRDKVGYQDWTVKYWTAFIQYCARTFEDRKVGPDPEWANQIINKKSKYRDIKTAQNDVMDAFKRSDYYDTWVKKIARY
ncbi:hypothetical protein JXQ70_20445 [bacterium]|nr:hypothetical protein [bacterium]